MIYQFPRVQITYTNGIKHTFGSYHSAARTLNWQPVNFFHNLNIHSRVPEDVESIDYIERPQSAPKQRATNVRGYVCCVEVGETFVSPMVFKDTNAAQKFFHFDRNTTLSLHSIKDALAGDGGTYAGYHWWYELLSGGGDDVEISQTIEDKKPVKLRNKEDGTELIFSSPHEAASALGAEKREIQRVLNGKRKTVKGHFAEYL